ncbi:MAG TPA: hypothetical protein VKZ41_00665 [Gemmatimonadales bacterium]|nr:hypothetical protein [Gemmatimonadales bacterium]
MSTHSPPAAYSYGRAVLWLVLALIAASFGYALWHIVANWKFITV